MSNSDPLKVEARGQYVVVTMDRPQRRNALGTETMAALEKTLADLANDPKFGAVVLTGSAPAFCAGSDLKELGGLSIADMSAHEAETARVVRSFSRFPLPIVTAVEGYALGGGLALAVSCDLVVTGRSAKWSMPEVANGWLPPWGLKALIDRVGPVKARMICWGVVPIDGADAHSLGLADLIAEDGQALAQASDVAQRLAALPRDAARSVKRFFASATADDAEALDKRADSFFVADCESAAAQETLKRFAVSA